MRINCNFHASSCAQDVVLEEKILGISTGFYNFPAQLTGVCVLESWLDGIGVSEGIVFNVERSGIHARFSGIQVLGVRFYCLLSTVYRLL